MTLNRSNSSEISQITFGGLASFIAVLNVFFWSSSGFIDFSYFRWLSIALIYLFMFFFIKTSELLPNVLGVCFLILTLLPSFIFSVDPVYSFAQLLRLVSIILFCLFISSLCIKSRLRVFRAVVYCVIVMTVLSALLYPFLNNALEQLDLTRIRYRGVFFHANITGFCAGLAVLFVIYIAIFEKWKKYSFYFTSALFVTCFFVLIKSDSRSALLAVLFGGGTLVFTNLKSNTCNKLLSIFLICLSILPLLITLIAGSIELGDNSYYESLMERVYLWREAFFLFKESYIFGNGFGLPLDTGEVTWNGNFIFYPYAHNFIMNTLAWAGVTGLFFVGLVLFLVFKSSVIAYKNNTRLIILARAYVFYVFTWSILDGALQAMWVTHLFFWLSVSVVFGMKK